MTVDQFEEANQKWKYSNERTSESWRKVEATAMDQDCKRSRIESRVEKGALMIVHVLPCWLASSYPIRGAFLKHISLRVSVESAINERKSSCHFAWSNGLIAAWMFVHPTNMAVILDLKGFPINQNYFYQHQNTTIIIEGESATCVISEIAMIILSLKFFFY